METKTTSPCDRAGRQDLIRQIESRTGRQLFCYIAPNARIVRDDVLFFQELIIHAGQYSTVDLLLHSLGGDFNVAEKLVHMLWEGATLDESTSNARILRVVVPDSAKSAATVMALGGGEILMSSTSELGPIDPQVRLPDKYNNWIWHSVFDYLGAYEKAKTDYRATPEDPVRRHVFETFDSVRVYQYRQLCERMRVCAEDLLKRHGGNYTAAPTKLMDTVRFPSHGQMIDWETAKNEAYLNVVFMPGQDPLWRLYWRLYVCLRLAVGRKEKIFESKAMSISV